MQAMLNTALVNPNAAAVDSGVTLLVVDDDEMNRLVLQTMLVRAGHRVLEACNGAQAIAMFTQHRPDAVLMDVMMPIMDGYEATQQIKALVGEHYVPVLFLTALTEGRALARCIEVGGDDFITKPFNATILKAKIDAALRVQQLYNKLEQQAQTIQQHNNYLQQEQEAAERIFRNIVHRGHLHESCFHYRISPAALFNGDMLLAAPLAAGGYRVLMGDFTGHGLPAAVGAIPAAEIFYVMTAKNRPLPELVRELNRKLKSILPSDIFLAACVLDISRDGVDIWNAGVPDVIIRNLPKGSPRYAASQHPALGILPDSVFSDHCVQVALTLGDRVYLYSDGVTEASNHAGEFFGEERLLQCLSEVAETENGVEKIWTAVNSFRLATEQADDMTLIEIIPGLIGGNAAP